MELLNNLTEAVKKGKRKDAEALVKQAVEQKLEAGTILDSLIAAMDDIGRRFKANEIFVPEVLIAARAMKTAMEILEPVLVDAGIKPEYKVVIGTVRGDLHDIGKNLVAMMLKGANFEVIDLGTDVTPEKFVEAARDNGANIICMSALLTTTMPAMKETVDCVKSSGLKTLTMIGGAPVTQEYADEIGASGYGADAATAVEVARSLVSA
jgi:5-methyltetrahydrofolate--homocysteine methyltransferase